MIIKLIDIYINTFKQILATTSAYQSLLFTDGASLWGWATPYFFAEPS